MRLKQFIQTLGLAVLSAVAAGCGPAVEPKSVKFYEENAADRKAMLVRCKDLSGDASKDADCTNARQAELSAAARAPTGTVDFKGVKVPK